MSRKNPVLTESMPCDTQVAANTVVVASATAGNAKLPAAAGAVGILGVTDELASSYNSQFYAAITFYGVVKCRMLTGTAIAVGDKLKVADTAGRVGPLTPAAAGAGTLKGIVGIALSAHASGAASDTLVDVLLTPGVMMYE
jgi:hypothetical protein